MNRQNNITYNSSVGIYSLKFSNNTMTFEGTAHKLAGSLISACSLCIKSLAVML